MGLFSKTVTCAKCGAEFEKGFLSGGTLCPKCSLEETENKVLAGNAQAFRQGFEKYYKALPGKLKSQSVDIQAAIQNTERIIRKYAELSAFNQELMKKAACDYDKMNDNDCKLFTTIFRCSVLINQGFSTMHTSFILSHGYPGVILDFDQVFAAAYKPVTSALFNTTSKEETYAFYYFTNDPFVPGLGMTTVIGSTLGMFSFGSDKRNREESINKILASTCRNLTYPVQNIKDLKKQVKSEGTVKGSIPPDLMMALIEQAEKNRGVFDDTSETERELYPGMEVLINRNGFMTSEEAAVNIGAMDRDARNFWKPYFAASAPELLPLFH